MSAINKFIYKKNIGITLITNDFWDLGIFE